MNAWLPQASYPCGNFSDTSSLKLSETKGSIGHAFTVCIRTDYKSAFFSVSSLAYIFHLHAFRTGPRAKQPRTVSLANPPSSSSLPHPPPYSILSLSSLPNVTLETGMSVFVTGADFWVVRFIGTTQFAKEVWLGNELRKPSKYILLMHEASLSSHLNARIFLHIM